MIHHSHSRLFTTRLVLGQWLLWLVLPLVMLLGLSGVAKGATQHPANPSIACIQYSPTAAFQVWQETEPHDVYGAIPTINILTGTSDGCGQQQVEDAEQLSSENGHTPSLYLQDLDGDGSQELLFYFHTGANQTVCYIYDLSGAQPKKVEGKTIASNMSGVEIGDDGMIEVKNLFYIRSSRYLTSSSYQLIDGYLTLIEEHTKIVSLNGESLPID